MNVNEEQDLRQVMRLLESAEKQIERVFRPLNLEMAMRTVLLGQHGIDFDGMQRAEALLRKLRGSKARTDWFGVDYNFEDAKERWTAVFQQVEPLRRLRPAIPDGHAG